MLKSRIVWIVTIVAFLSSFQARAQNIVLDGGTLIDGTGKAPINNAVVVVENGRIKAVGAR